MPEGSPWRSGLSNGQMVNIITGEILTRCGLKNGTKSEIAFQIGSEGCATSNGLLKNAIVFDGLANGDPESATIRKFTS
jgi:hypothetical protein